MGKRFKNLVIFICDSLRYDFAKYLGFKSKIIKALAPSTSTPASIASIISGTDPLQHNVRFFTDRLDKRINTIFNYFPNYEFYDHPYDAVRRVILGFKTRPKELYEMREPFVWIERLMDTHVPYGVLDHGNEITWTHQQWRSYIRKLRSLELNPIKEYMKGVLKARRHIQWHLRQLEEMGVKNRTLVVICGDHGENLRPLTAGNHIPIPFTKELVEVPVIFIPDQDVSPIMRLYDLLPTVLDILEISSWKRSMYKKKLKKVRGIVLVWEHIFTLWELSESYCKMIDVLNGGRVNYLIKKELIYACNHKITLPLMWKMREIIKKNTKFLMRTR